MAQAIGEGSNTYSGAYRVNQPGSRLPDFTPGASSYFNTSNCFTFTGADCTSPFTAGETLPGGQPEFNLCGGATYGATSWYEVHPDVSGTISVYVRGNAIPPPNDFDAVITAFRFNRANGIPQGPFPCTNQQPSTGTEQLFLNVRKGESWRVQVGGVNEEADYYEIRFGFIRDTDNDGKYDFEDLCPTRSGTLSNGCPSAPPPRDTDGDGIIDATDDCPNENSRARDPGGNGCLDRLLLRPEIRLNPGSFCKNGRCLGLKAKSVTVSDVTRGTKVEISCSRGACRTKSATAKGSRLTVKLKKNLRAGVRLAVRVTKPGAVGRYVSYKILRNDYDRDNRVRCLKPGTRGPLGCSNSLWVR